MIIHPDGRLEGTPEELAVYQEAKDKKAKEDLNKLTGTGSAPWIKPWGTGSASSTKKCPNPCFCDGSCQNGSIISYL